MTHFSSAIFTSHTLRKTKLLWKQFWQVLASLFWLSQLDAVFWNKHSTIFCSQSWSSARQVIDGESLFWHHIWLLMCSTDSMLYGRLRFPGGGGWGIFWLDKSRRHCIIHCRRGSGAWPGQKVCRSLLIISSLSSLSPATVTKPRMWSHGKRFVGTSGFLKISFPLHHEKVLHCTEAIITNLFQRFYCPQGNNAVFSWVSGH